MLPYDPAGHADGLSFTLKAPQMACAKRSAEVLRAMFAEVGVTATVVPTEFPAAWIPEVFTRHDFDMTVVVHTEPFDIGIYARPDSCFGFRDRSVEAEIAPAEGATDIAVRDAACGEVQRILAEKGPALYFKRSPSSACGTPGSAARGRRAPPLERPDRGALGRPSG